MRILNARMMTMTLIGFDHRNSVFSYYRTERDDDENVE